MTVEKGDTITLSAEGLEDGVGVYWEFFPMGALANMDQSTQYGGFEFTVGPFTGATSDAYVRLITEEGQKTFAAIKIVDSSAPVEPEEPEEVLTISPNVFTAMKNEVVTFTADGLSDYSGLSWRIAEEECLEDPSQASQEGGQEYSVGPFNATADGIMIIAEKSDGNFASATLNIIENFGVSVSGVPIENDGKVKVAIDESVTFKLESAEDASNYTWQFFPPRNLQDVNQSMQMGGEEYTVGPFVNPTIEGEMGPYHIHLTNKEGKKVMVEVVVNE